MRLRALLLGQPKKYPLWDIFLMKRGNYSSFYAGRVAGGKMLSPIGARRLSIKKKFKSKRHIEN